jgi:hypothetical protein
MGDFEIEVVQATPKRILRVRVTETAADRVNGERAGG